MEVLRDERGPVVRVSRELMEVCRYTSKRVTAHARDGAVTLWGGRYWSESMIAYAGLSATRRNIRVLYDPEDLSTLVVEPDGRDRITCDRIGGTGYRDEAAAKETARARRRRMRKIKEAASEAGIDPATLRKYALESAMAAVEIEAAAKGATTKEAADGILHPGAAA